MKASEEALVHHKDFEHLRNEMVERQIVTRGVRDPLVLNAMRRVPREAFLPERMAEFAYEDTPLPIEAAQTISQPYIVAFMIEALNLEGGERVLEIGTGSGYAAAVLGEIAGEVYTIERIEQLANIAAHRLESLGYANVNVIHEDGTKGWPRHAPYDAIVVTAGGPEVPEAFKQQLAVGGHLVIPVGLSPAAQELVRVTRTDLDTFRQEDLADVRFVPLIGEDGWKDRRESSRGRIAKPGLSAAIRNAAEEIDDVGNPDMSRILSRIGDARLVLIGESTHGTSEFYRFRERLTRELISKMGFGFVAAEADWPDAARIDHYVRDFDRPPPDWEAFARFPTWMWRNRETHDFVEWLRRYNGDEIDSERRAAFYGLDLYSLFTSIRAVLAYLDEVDPEAAAIARHRYGCLTPWESDPAAYGHAALTERYRSCAGEVARMLNDLMEKRQSYVVHDGERFADAIVNARLIRSAERYYRKMYFGSRESWNLRDQHMFDTLQMVMALRGPQSRGVVWAHNSHIGDARATEMGARREHNLGQLCREAFGPDVYIVGFGTDRGTVAAASSWDAPMEVMEIRAALPESHEGQCRETGLQAFSLPLGRENGAPLLEQLEDPRLQRAIGVIYRPETERESHYFHAVLPRQFDEYVWIAETSAVTPLETGQVQGLPDTYPFGV